MKRYQQWIIVWIICLVGSRLPSAFAQSSANFALKNSVVDEAGCAAASANFLVIDAVGQAGPAGSSSSAGFIESSGFLAIPAAPIGEFNIVVDGNKDNFYGQLTGPDDGYLQLRSYAYNDNGKPDNDADLSAKIWTAWDNEWFYLYEEVKDNILSGNATDRWEEDGFELNVDPQPTSEANTVFDVVLTALGMATPGVVAESNLNGVAEAQKKWARKTIAGGYALEMAIQWPAINWGTETITPAEGNIFGAAIRQHDNDGSAKRDASVQWSAVMLDVVWNTPKYHGTVKFLEDHELQFIARNNMTGVSNPVPYDGSDYNPADKILEAEFAQLSGETSVQSDASAHGGAFVPMRDSGTITWKLTYVAVSDQYSLKFCYRIPFGAKTQNLFVNGTQLADIVFDGSENVWITKDITVPLTAGENIVVIQKFWGWMDFDYLAGPFEDTGVAEDISSKPLPTEFILKPNYPNPFNPATTICYSLPHGCQVRVVVYDVVGREVAVIADGSQAAGEYRVMFDGKSFNSGIYMCRLTAGAEVQVMKMALVK